MGQTDRVSEAGLCPNVVRQLVHCKNSRCVCVCSVFGHIQGHIPLGDIQIEEKVV